jgi:hypothetical protein
MLPGLGEETRAGKQNHEKKTRMLICCFLARPIHPSKKREARDLAALVMFAGSTFSDTERNGSEAPFVSADRFRMNGPYRS